MADAVRSLRVGINVATTDKRWAKAAKLAGRGCVFFSHSDEMIHFCAQRSYIMLVADDKQTAIIEVLVKGRKLEDIQVWKVMHMEESK